jgi:hypothetical protein
VTLVGRRELPQRVREAEPAEKRREVERPDAEDVCVVAADGDVEADAGAVERGRITAD